MSYNLTNATDAAVDERLGLCAVKVPFVVPPGPDWATTLRTALSIYPAEIAQLGLPIAKREVKQRTDSGYDLTFHVEGQFDPTNPYSEEFSLDGTTSQDPVESIPNIRFLMDKYQGERRDDGSVYFPVTVIVNGQEVKNRMAGVKVFYNAGLVWTKTSLSTVFVPTLVRALGCIDTPPSGRLGQQPPSLDGDRNWLKMRVRAAWRGNVWRIEESWMMSGVGGWNPDMYRQR